MRGNIAARAGRWSAAHRKTAIAGWFVFVIAAFVIGGALGTREIKDSEGGSGESGDASKVLEREFEGSVTERVLVQSRRGSARDPQFQAALRDVDQRISGLASVKTVRSPHRRGGRGLLSKDGRSAMVEFELRGGEKQAEKRIDSILATTSAAQKAHPGVRIEQFGDMSTEKAFEKAAEEDLAKARNLSLPVTLGILVVAFGALAAAGVPVLLALTGVMATLGLVAVASRIAPVDGAVAEVVLLVGMAVGVDYALFYLRREREERAAGRSPEAALQAAAATSGRSVLVSGLTVMAAMAGMYLTGHPTFSSFATGTIMVVAVAVIGSLTVLPAMLSALGDRVMKGRLPLIGRRRESGAGIWGAILDRVLRRPLLSAVASGGLLVALAVPALSLHTADPGVDGLPAGLEISDTMKRMDRAFPGGDMPATVVVQAADVGSSQAADGIRALMDDALASGQVRRPVTVDLNEERTAAVVSLPLVGGGTDATSNEALETLREELIPSTLGRVDGLKASVTGMTAESRDFNDLMKSRAPLVFAFVMALAFLLLMVTFRSIVIPLKAIVLNLLSVAASYGVLVLVFQHGIGESLLGFESTGAITPWLPMFLFVILFGLSMDYHVFILGRIREAFDGGMRTEDAVAHGIKATAGVVTSAAAVMVAVFSVFATLSALEFKQMGVGLAAAILIDATIIRAVLLPATMKLLGDWNWYLPSSLGWLPRVGRRPVGEGAGA